MDVEIVLNYQILKDKAFIKSAATEFISAEWKNIQHKKYISNFDPQKYPLLSTEVKYLKIDGNVKIEFDEKNVRWYFYVLENEGPIIQVEDGGEQGPVDLATNYILPSSDFHNLWENLYYEDEIKENLLRYAKSMMEFSSKGIDCNIINCNRVILLHGPPGTGKTSLCKALAQKLTIRLQEQYSNGLLIEINSHSLLSKYFSESGKLVANMFKKIKEAIENPNLFVCVLIDEIESLAHARDQCMSGNEPSDSVRVVNAVLTQIDQMKRHNNVLILTTSNLTDSIDLAFIDRADIKQYLGLPSKAAIKQIYSTCILELIRTKFIMDCLEIEDFIDNSQFDEVCAKSVGLSGRSLRKIPFIAHALFLAESSNTLSNFLIAMSKAIEREINEKTHFKNHN